MADALGLDIRELSSAGVGVGDMTETRECMSAARASLWAKSE